MKCQRRFDGNNGILTRASWTLLSPNKVWPASTASRTISPGWVLVTATSSISVTFLPETCAACAISFCTRLRFASILLTTSNQSISAWQIQPADPAQAEDTLGQPLGCADLLHILSANPLGLHTLRRCPARER